MRAITVRGPWAHGIAWWGKNRENRGATFPAKYRGEVMIHVGQAWAPRGATDPRMVEAAKASANPPPWWTHGAIDPTGLPTGAILSVERLVDVHRATPECCAEGGACWPWGEATYEAADGSTVDEVTHLVFGEHRPLEDPVPWRKGKLGLWTPPAELTALVDAELAVTEWR